MKIALINGSPKSKDSASGILINDLKTFISSDTKEFMFNTPKIGDDFMKHINSFDAFVFFFPLYVDGIPSHLLSCLCQLEDTGIINKDTKVYGVVNNGFYEGVQNDVALEILKNWSDRMGLKWGMGIGVGSGGGLCGMKSLPIDKGPKAPLGIALKEFAQVIQSKSSSENIYTQLKMPRFLYKFSAESLWKSAIKANGGKIKDIKRRL